MVYVATLSKYQSVMHWQLIIAVVDNIVAKTLRILACTPVNKYKSSTINSQCCTN